MPDGGTIPRPDVARDALAGLLAPQKTLPAKLFYDAEGCRLFGLITDLPEYYLTRTELGLLRTIAPDVGRRAPAGAAVIEYGAGSELKAAILLGALRRPAAYLPIDVAEEMLAESQPRLAPQFPGLVIRPVVGDFLAPFRLPPIVDGLPRLGFFPGSTIGNLEPPVAVRFLRQARETLGVGSMLLVGVDLRKDPSILLPAYDDASGVTAAFNRNVLLRLNREAGADFDPDAFRHLALWNDREGRIEMHLISRRAQRVRVADQTVSFAEGETIHTENSYKHTPERFLNLAGDAGWVRMQLWTDADDLFSIHLLEAGGQ